MLQQLNMASTLLKMATPKDNNIKYIIKYFKSITDHQLSVMFH